MWAGLAIVLASSGLVGAAARAQAAPGVDGAVSGTPGQLLRAAISAAKSEAGVDWVTASHTSYSTVTLTTEAGRDGGLQTINVRIGTKTGRLSVVQAGTTVYFRGNTSGLRNYLGFTTHAAQKEAGHWLRVRNTTRKLGALYLTLAEGLTIGSLVSELDMTGHITETPAKKVADQQAMGLHGTTDPTLMVPATSEALYVKSTGGHLPVEAVRKYGKETGSMVFSDWGRAPSVSAPSGAVPVSTGWIAGYSRP